MAPVRDVAAIGQRNSPRDGTDASATASDGAQAASSADASAQTRSGKRGATQLGAKQLTSDQERLVQDLSTTDQKVRSHESAHQSAAGSLGGAVSYTYRTGPDGKSYVVGGEVSVDMTAGRTPQETLAKAEQIRAAALAPADPSPQDLSVAAEAAQMEAAAQQELIHQQMAALQTQHAGKPGQVAVLGAQALPGKDVHLSRPHVAQGRRAGQSVAAAEAEVARSTADSNANDKLSRPVTSSVSDVGAQAESTLATLQSDRAAAGTTHSQVQQIARLASAAYRM
jgi:hypothetical protein